MAPQIFRVGPTSAHPVRSQRIFIPVALPRRRPTSHNSCRPRASLRGTWRLCSPESSTEFVTSGKSGVCPRSSHYP
eukprot:8422668-Pyramimonas_sp.AAC.1